MDEFLDTEKLPRPNHKEIWNMNRLIMSKEIVSIIKNLPTKNSPGSYGFIGDFYQILKKN